MQDREGGTLEGQCLAHLWSLLVADQSFPLELSPIYSFSISFHTVSCIKDFKLVIRKMSITTKKQWKK